MSPFYYTPMTLEEAENNFNGGCNTTLDCPARQECWPHANPQDGGDLGQCDCFYIFNLGGPTCQTTSAKNWAMFFFYFLFTLAHRGGTLYLIVQSLLRLKKLDGWFPPTAQMVMLWMFFGNMVIGGINELRQSFDLLGVVVYDGQQEFAWASNFQQSIEAFERFTFFNGEGRTSLCVEHNRAYLTSFDYYDFDDNPMCEPGSANFTTRLSRQYRLIAKDDSWVTWLVCDVAKLTLLESLHYIPLLFANLIYINIVRASNSLKKATGGLGCLNCTIYFAVLIRIIAAIWSLISTYLMLTHGGGLRHDRVYNYEWPYYVIMIQWIGDQIGLSTVIVGWGMLVSMMIPKDKRNLALKILIGCIIPVTSLLLSLYVFLFMTVQEKEQWNSKESYQIFGVHFYHVCPAIADLYMWWINIAFVAWVLGANSLIAWSYTKQLAKQSEDMTETQKQAQKKKGKFLIMILIVFAVDLTISFEYCGMHASVLWDNPLARNSEPMPFQFALTGAQYHSHADASTGECNAQSYRYYQRSNQKFGRAEVINKTLDEQDIPFLAAQCNFLTDAPYPGDTPPVSGFDRDASYFGTWILLLGNRMVHSFHVVCAVIPAFFSTRNRMKALNKVKPVKKKVGSGRK